MKAFRKPGSQEQSYDGKLVDEFSLEVKPWRDAFRFEFSATIDRSGSRWTVIEVELDERDVERLYGSLLEGRIKQIESLEVALRQSEKQLESLREETIAKECKLLKRLTKIYEDPGVNGAVASKLLKVIDSLE